MSSSRQLSRQGLPVMSDIQLGILQSLRAAKRRDDPFVLVSAHPRTLRSMVEHDWMYEGQEKHFAITGRGLNALAVYEAPSPRHDDGLCPDCRFRPVHVYTTGRRDGYCLECKKEHQRLGYKRNAQQVRSITCPQCKERPRQQYSHGRYHAYCKECRHANRAEERRLRRIRDLERVQRGEFLPCRCCHEKPRYVTGKTVQDYCPECYHQKQRRRMFARVMYR